MAFALWLMPVFLYADPLSSGRPIFAQQNGSDPTVPYQVNVNHTDNGDGTINITVGGAGGSQTPWTSNIDAGGYNLYNVTNINVSDAAYSATDWDSNLTVPTKNAIRDKFESLGSGGNVSATPFALDYVAYGVSPTLIKGVSIFTYNDTLELLTVPNITSTGNVKGATYGSDGTVSDAELLYINTLSSNAQTQLNGKQATVTEGSLADNVIVSADIKDGVILSGDLSWDAALTDGDFVTYDSTGTNFAPITPHAGTNIAADLEEEVTEGSLADSTIVSADIKDGTIVAADIGSGEVLLPGGTGAGLTAVANVTNNRHGFDYTITNGTSAITSGWVGFTEIANAFTLTRTTFQSLDFTKGNATIVVKRCPATATGILNLTEANFTTAGNFTINGSTTNIDTTLPGWTTAWTAGDLILFNVTEINGFKQIQLSGNNTGL